jgi:hypothetical protein
LTYYLSFVRIAAGEYLIMFLFYEFLFYFIFLFYKLYSFLDDNYFFNLQGSKIDKYINKNNLTNITDNFVHTKNKFFSKYSPEVYKCLIDSTLVAMIITTIKLVFSYKLIFSNIYCIDIYIKKIDLVSSFGIYFTYFKIIYFLFFFIFVLFIIYSLNFKRYSTNIDKPIGLQDNNGMLIGYENNNPIYFSDNGFYQNILITGSIGSGKTTGAISNILDYLVSKNIYGLVLDVKGNYKETVKFIADKYNKKVIEISLLSDFNYNPLNKPYLSSFEIASMLRSVVVNLSEINNSDSFWLDKAETFIKDFIVLIRVYNSYVSFDEIHRLVVDKEYLLNKIEIVKNKVLSNLLSDDLIYEINISILNLTKEFLNLDERTIGIIKSEITRVTSIFVSNQILKNKFCSNSTEINFKNNQLVVFSIDIANNRKLSKIISTYLKLDFQRQILNFNSKPIFFICDEYQEFVNKEDAHFFSLSREFKCINVVSMQSYTSLTESLNKLDSSKVIIQNLVNKIWFRNDDVNTIEEIVKQIGKEEKDRVSISINESSKETKYSMFLDKFKNIKSSLNESYTINKSLENVIDFNYISKKLQTFEALCLLSDGNKMSVHKKIKFSMYNINNKT